jgi:hypothetical protein
MTTIATYSDESFTLLQIRQCTSVSFGPDNGALNCNAGHPPQGGTARRHRTTTEAVNNSLACFAKLKPKDVVMINWCGHGNEGFLETGFGQTGHPDMATNYIMKWNENSWGPELDRLARKSSRTQMLSIYSCDTGAGELGADVLYSIARRLKVPVRGRTGLTFCGSGGIYFEASSVWQVATPTTRPHKIDSPHHHALLSMGKTVGPFLIRSIKSVELEVPGRTPRLITGQTATEFLRVCFGSEPMDKPGEPTALISGAFTVRTGKILRKFVIYNDRLIEDLKSGQVYYPGTNLRGLLQII